MIAREAFSGAAGGPIAIGAMEFFSARAAYPLMAIPFAISIVMAMGSPQAEPAPLVIVVNNLSWGFLIAPVGAGALLLALFAFVWRNVVARGPNKGDTWPTRWW